MNMLKVMLLPYAVIALAGCAATSVPKDKLEQRTSMAIGREVGTFSISNQQSDGGGMFNYDVRARDGSTYKCTIHEAPGIQKIMSFGMAPGTSSALCTEFGKKASGKSSETTSKDPTNKPGCNALLKAAGKC